MNSESILSILNYRKPFPMTKRLMILWPWLYIGVVNLYTGTIFQTYNDDDAHDAAAAAAAAAAADDDDDDYDHDHGDHHHHHAL